MHSCTPIYFIFGREMAVRIMERKQAHLVVLSINSVSWTQGAGLQCFLVGESVTAALHRLN